MPQFRRIAQLPPPDPGMMPPGPLGAPPMGGMPTAPMAAPGAPPSPEREEIGSPLDSLGKILYDVDAPTLVMQMTGSAPEEIAEKIWKLYGGPDKDVISKGKPGERVDKKDVPPEKEKEEQAVTEDQRWLRLPEGVSIDDITSLKELITTIKGLMLNTSKNTAKANGGGPGGPGGMPPGPMASAKGLVRLAATLDNEGMYKQADWVDRLLI